jgi:anti-sigma B factor antagonist
VTLGGYIDLSTGAQLRDVLEAAAETAPFLIVDMSRLAFMDSTGLSVLIDMYRRLDKRSGTLALAAPRPIVAKVLSISGLDLVLNVHASVADAVAVCAGEDPDR